MNGSDDGHSRLVKCESLLVIVGSSLDMFANRPPNCF
jgi:hypothetical protein